MFSSSVLASVFIFSLALQASAHALIAPMLGVNGIPVRNDVQRPSNAKPCGNVDIASTIDSSKMVHVGRNGTFTVNVTDFNGGQDGSRHVSVKIDRTGTGSSFVTGTMKKNGDLNPSSAGSEYAIAALPQGTKCTGGKSKNLCLASFETTAGFGNCVVVKQLGSSSIAAHSKNATSKQNANGEGPRMGATRMGGHTGNHKNQHGAVSNVTNPETGKMNNIQARAVGTRAPRALRRVLE